MRKVHFCVQILINGNKFYLISPKEDPDTQPCYIPLHYVYSIHPISENKMQHSFLIQQASLLLNIIMNALEIFPIKHRGEVL